MQSFTAQITQAMERQDLTQADVAELLGVSRVTVWRKFRDPDGWRVGELKILAQTLDTDFLIESP